MKNIRCLIIEDEPLAAEILRDHIGQVEQLKLIGQCRDAIQAMGLLQEENIDLIFLDLHLPRIKGFEFLQSLAVPPRIIVTTAYSEYALESYEHNIVDYLLKPIELPRFLKAIQKLLRLEKGQASPMAKQSSGPSGFLFFRVNKKQVKVYLKEIHYIESLRDYIRVYHDGGTLVTKMPLGTLDQQLPPQHFRRIHRSFIIALDRVNTYDARSVEIEKQTIPIGRHYRKAIEAYWESLGQ